MALRRIKSECRFAKDRATSLFAFRLVTLKRAKFCLERSQSFGLNPFGLFFDNGSGSLANDVDDHVELR
jgi:hypothetical protein